jgi:hypothetical protein
VYHSIDNGKSWGAINSGLTNTSVDALGFSGTTLFAGTNNGVFVSDDIGKSWTPVNSSLANIYVDALVISGTNVFVGTDGGVWRRPISEMVTAVKEGGGGSPSRFSLSQNYPEPFNPSTTIEYSLPVNAHVRLQIFNNLGQRVATLYEGEQAAGYQKVQWNARVSSGIYFYHIEATALDDPNKYFVDTKKMLLMR